jgi:hypothetical protein
MDDQQHDIEDVYAFNTKQQQDTQKYIAQRFSADLGEQLPPYQQAFTQTRASYGGASSSTADMDANTQTKRRSQSEGAQKQPFKKSAVSTDMNVDKAAAMSNPKKKPANAIMLAIADTKKRDDREPQGQGNRQGKRQTPQSNS